MRIEAPLDKALFSTKFTRQFSYYDGFVFEFQDTRLGPAAVLAAGGRYDALTVQLGADAPIPSIGCAVRPGRVRCVSGGRAMDR